MTHICVNSTQCIKYTNVFYGVLMNSIKERLQEVVTYSGLSLAELARTTGMTRDRWANMLYHTTRVGDDHIEAAVKLWPQYAYWLTTGQTIPNAGQISPEIEEARSNSKKAPKATG